MAKGKAKKSAALLTVSDFERTARSRLSKMAYDYFRSGADSERTLKNNLAAFRRWVIWYKVLVDVSSVADRESSALATTVLGRSISAPIMIAPTAYHKLAHPAGEIATALAAKSFGTVYVASTLATTSLEDIADQSDAPKWFQLYVHKDRDFTRSLVERAETAGYEALVVTVDTPLLGRRLRDLHNGFHLPEGLSMANLEEMSTAPREGSLLMNYVADRHDAAFTWSDIGWLREMSHLPIVLKGVVRADDASRAADLGVAGIIVSNHGGRQLDHSPATIDALPGVVRAVGGRAEVYMDGGIRFGTDILKALALGARAVLVGRPVLWGLAADGQLGVERVLHMLRDDLARALALSGAPSVRDLDSSFVAPR